MNELQEPCFFPQGDLGPFNPGLPVDVPVWLALNLKQRQKCRIIPPDWMDVGNYLCWPKKNKKKNNIFGLLNHF